MLQLRFIVTFVLLYQFLFWSCVLYTFTEPDIWNMTLALIRESERRYAYVIIAFILAAWDFRDRLKLQQ